MKVTPLASAKGAHFWGLQLPIGGAQDFFGDCFCVTEKLNGACAGQLWYGNVNCEGSCVKSVLEGLVCRPGGWWLVFGVGTQG